MPKIVNGKLVADSASDDVVNLNIPVLSDEVKVLPNKNKIIRFIV